MFLKHFGLIEQPFGVTPDPRFLFLGAKHREALASLVYGTETDRGFLALITEPGMGKTSLLFQYLEGMRHKARSAFLFNTDGDSRALMRHLLSDLGLDSSGQDLAGMHAMLNQVLLEEMNAGKRFLLVIDEAQNLDEKVLESVRLLSNFETPWKKLMQIVIAGQPQLAEQLRRPSMSQLRQRISSIIRLEPFTPEETNAYISHRLWIAGYSGPSMFTSGACALIAEHGAGIPREINNLCFNSMSLAFATGRKQVDEEMVREAISDLEIESLRCLPQTSVPVVASSQSIVGVERSARRARPNRWRLIPAMASICAAILLGTALENVWKSGPRTPLPGVLPTVEAATLPIKSSSHASTRHSTRRIRKPAHANANDAVLAITVEKDDTLQHLSQRYLGRFDLEVLIKICTLNPAITDPNKIKAGQRLLMPLNLHRESAAKARAAAEMTPLAAEKDKP